MMTEWDSQVYAFVSCAYARYSRDGDANRAIEETTRLASETMSDAAIEEGVKQFNEIIAKEG